MCFSMCRSVICFCQPAVFFWAEWDSRLKEADAEWVGGKGPGLGLIRLCHTACAQHPASCTKPPPLQWAHWSATSPSECYQHRRHTAPQAGITVFSMKLPGGGSRAKREVEERGGGAQCSISSLLSLKGRGHWQNRAVGKGSQENNRRIHHFSHPVLSHFVPLDENHQHCCEAKW